jgi:hypothetical protein
MRLYPAEPMSTTSENYCEVVLVSNSREPLKLVVTRKMAEIVKFATRGVCPGHSQALPARGPRVIRRINWLRASFTSCAAATFLLLSEQAEGKRALAVFEVCPSAA